MVHSLKGSEYGMTYFRPSSGALIPVHIFYQSEPYMTKNPPFPCVSLHVIFLCLVLTLGLFFTGCDSGDDPMSTPVLTRIEIQSSIANNLLDVGEESELTVAGFDQFGVIFEIAADIFWSVSNESVSVSSTGLVRALEVGTSTITVMVDELSDTYQVAVWDSNAPRVEYYISDAGDVGSPPFQILKYIDGQDPVRFTNENLDWPQDIVFLEDQEVVLISNLNSGSISRHNANTGAFIDFFARGIDGPTRMKIGRDGLLYVLQWRGSGLVKRYDLEGTFVDDFTSVGVSQSIGIDWDGQGNLYVSSFNDGSNGFVRKYDTEGNDLGIFANTTLRGPTNIWFSGSSLFVNDWSAGMVKEFDAEGAYVGDFITGLQLPEGIAMDADGAILIGNGGTGAILRFNSEGRSQGALFPAGSAGLMTPNAITIRRVNF